MLCEGFIDSDVALQSVHDVGATYVAAWMPNSVPVVFFGKMHNAKHVSEGHVVSFMSVTSN